MRLYLIGFMTAGKTSLGRQLAQTLDWQFVDLDHALEQEQGRSIAAIFEQEGEDYFRLAERQTLESTALAYPTQTVFACGGGLPCFFDNMQRLHALGRSIYLQLPPKELLRRIRQDRADRPLVRDRSPEELEQYVRDLLTHRQAFYTQADWILPQEAQTVERMVACLEEK